jgi:hypothetical protein
MMAVIGAVLGTGGMAGEVSPSRPPPETIIRVVGTAGSGLQVHHYDGSVDYLPTRSETLAECGEYDGVVDRVRCRVEVRTSYSHLVATQQALRYAHRPTAPDVHRRPSPAMARPSLHP